jgi:cytochrome c oxidase assembly protein subunit 15
MQYRKQIGWWLMTGVIMIVIQVVLGGITRLTGSGLSITEWKPILGSIPPMNEADWNHAFDLYKSATGQYKYLNADFTLSDFKFIYFWEWLHRNWARFIGVVFLLPYGWFWYKKAFTPEMVPKLIALFVLGIAQGLIGWIMVKSGLTDDNLYVSHIRLAIHFVSALVLLAFTYWFAMDVMIPSSARQSNPTYHRWVTFILGLLLLQLVYGAFMAGLKAASAASTWPDINGSYFPEALVHQNWVNHPIVVHFVHRTLAYLLFVAILFISIRSAKMNGSLLWKKWRFLPMILVFIQVLLGIGSVLMATETQRNGFGAFEWAAQIHQIVAMFLLMALLFHLFLVRDQKS